MELWKILAFAAVVAVSAAIGVRFGSKYKKRDALLSDILLMCNYLIGDIGFQKSRLKANIERLIEMLGDEIGSMLRGYHSLLESNSDLDFETLKAAIPNKHLTEEENTRFLQLLAALGKSDAESEIKTITAFREGFEPFRESAAGERKKFGALYPKLGLLAGLGIGIFIL